MPVSVSFQYLFHVTFSVINCPSQNFYEVLTTDYLAKTPIGDIYNEINGEDDTLFPEDPELDFTRRVTVTDANVAFVKRSGELDSVLFANSVIVVRQRSEAGASAGQLSVIRYW